ncbi:MAG: hypothetical protein M1430_14345 [Betaproteobacteria bacterium]|jgi:hypothetical protein|nr:hypothetical protein [Betaproteobacteria bacterium]
MKTPDTAKTVSSATRQGAQILPFTFPARTNTACSEILARLLSGEVLTGMDGVFEVSTTRLAAHVHYLAESYGVPTEANDRAVGCNDGRVVTVKAYSLPHNVIQSARAAGAAPWIASVRADRAALRAKAAQAQAQAARMNAARKRHTPPGQGDLFVNGGAAC